MASTILIVDDDRDVREITAVIISRLGYEVIQAQNGAEALALLGGGRQVDLLMVDLTMPGMSGFELAAAVRSRWASVQVLFVTGYDSDNPRFRNQLSGETAVRKPLTAGQLRAAIAQALTGRDKQRSGSNRS